MLELRDWWVFFDSSISNSSHSISPTSHASIPTSASAPTFIIPFRLPLRYCLEWGAGSIEPRRQASPALFQIGLTPMTVKFAISISLSSPNSILFFIALSSTIHNHSQCHTLLRHSTPTLFCSIWSVFNTFILTIPFHELNWTAIGWHPYGLDIGSGSCLGQSRARHRRRSWIRRRSYPWQACCRQPVSLQAAHQGARDG